MEDINVAAEAPIAPAGPVMLRDRPEPPEARAAFVQRWLDDVLQARKHWEPDFKRMRRNMDMASGKHWPNQREDDPRYRVNLIQRVLKTTVSSLYAKNPTIIFKRRPKLDFKIWDGDPQTAAEAQQAVAMSTQLQADPAAAMAAPEQVASVMAAAAQAQALLADIQEGLARRQMLDRIGKTLVACGQYYLDECEPKFKTQMKQMIRRARTTAVGYVKLGFQREMDLASDTKTRIADHADRLAVIGQLSADLQDGEIDPHSAERAELEAAVAALRNEPMQIVREGPVFGFPGSTKIIPSISTEKLMGWVGSEWIAEEILLTPDRIKQVYGVDVGKDYKAFKTVGGSPEGGMVRPIRPGSKDSKRAGGLARVFEIYDKLTGMKLVICEGYPDFLQEPASPDVFIEQFFPYFAITFNDVEDEGRLFPDSDVENLTHPQREFNRTKEALRQHRIANRPLYASPKGAFEDDEVKTLGNYPAHHVIELNGLDKGRPVSDILQPVPKVGVDPNIYQTAEIFDDMQRVTGNAEANLGGTAGGTATESSIAENSRQGSIGLDGDDFDDMLGALFRALGTVMLTELDQATVQEIAGVGAVWPQLSREDVAKELLLDVKGGSSGRPDAAREAAKIERVAPFLLQIPGVSPKYLAEKFITAVDADVDMDQAFAEGLPSITAMNQRTQVNQAANDPNAQGGQGGGAQKAHEARDQGQPGYSPVAN